MIRLNRYAAPLCASSFVVFAAANAVHAEILPTFTLRELIIRADHIVVAEPVDSAVLTGKDLKFVVRDVLRSGRVKTGDSIAIRDMDYYKFDPPFGRPAKPNEDAETRPRCKQALLFLSDPQSRRNEPADPSSFVLTISGVRYLTDKGKVLSPRQQMNPGPYFFVEQSGDDWAKLLDRTRLDCEAIAAVRGLREIADPAERNRTLFDWIEKHGPEFTGTYFNGVDDPYGGWGSLENDVFVWILDSCRLDDALEAIKMSRSINKRPWFQWPSGNTPTFASIEGRKLLLRIAADPQEPIEDRQAALYRLGDSLWPKGQFDKPLGLSCVTAEENADLIDAVLQLTKVDDGQLRRFAVHVLRLAVSLPVGAKRRGGGTPTKQNVIDAITEVYQRHPPGYARTEIAQTLIEIGGEDVWKQVSGNRGKILVNLQNCQVRRFQGGAKLSLSVFKDSRQAIQELYTAERPTLLLERLSDEKPPRVLEQKSIELSELTDDGNGFGGPKSVNVLAGDLAEGTWRLTVMGKAGDRGQYGWRSEPALIELKGDAK